MKTGGRSRKEAIQKIDLLSLLSLFSSHKAAKTIISPSEIQHCSRRLLKMNLQEGTLLIKIRSPTIIKRKLINKYNCCNQKSNSPRNNYRKYRIKSKKNKKMYSLKNHNFMCLSKIQVSKSPKLRNKIIKIH